MLAAAMVTGGAAAFLWIATADQRPLVAVIPTFLLGTLYQLDILYGLLRAGRLDDTSLGELLRIPKSR